MRSRTLGLLLVLGGLCAVAPGCTGPGLEPPGGGKGSSGGGFGNNGPNVQPDAGADQDTTGGGAGTLAGPVDDGEDGGVDDDAGVPEP